MRKAIITVYYPSKENIANIIDIANQVDKLFVCDNSLTNKFDLFFAGNKKIEYIHFGENLGLSIAFNKILKNSCYDWNDDDYVIFFDQDSIISENYIDILVGEYKKMKSLDENIGCLGPVYFNNSNNTIEIPKAKIEIVEKCYKVKSIITSSMITTYKNLKEISFWNENVFLDMADWDLCWRMIAQGKICCLSENVVLNHTIGNGQKKIGIIKIRVGSPIREYYQTRDCLYLLKESYVPLKYKIRFVAMVTIRPIIHILFLENKSERLFYIKKGILDFFKNIRGELKENTKNR